MPYAKSADRYSGRYPVSACSSGSGGGTVSGNSGGISGSPNHALPGASVRTMEKVEEIALPPSLQRFITAPATTRLQQTQVNLFFFIGCLVILNIAFDIAKTLHDGDNKKKNHCSFHSLPTKKES